MAKAPKSPARPKPQPKTDEEKKKRRRAHDPERLERVKDEGGIAAGSFIGGLLSAERHRVLSAFCKQRNGDRNRIDPALGARVMAGQACDSSRERFIKRRMARRRAAVVAQAARRRGVSRARRKLFDR